VFDLGLESSSLAAEVALLQSTKTAENSTLLYRQSDLEDMSKALAFELKGCFSSRLHILFKVFVVVFDS
jgi:hypothetical protein